MEDAEQTRSREKVARHLSEDYYLRVGHDLVNTANFLNDRPDPDLATISLALQGVLLANAEILFELSRLAANRTARGESPYLSWGHE